MKQRITAIVLTLALSLGVSACGAGAKAPAASSAAASYAASASSATASSAAAVDSAASASCKDPAAVSGGKGPALSDVTDPAAGDTAERLGREAEAVVEMNLEGTTEQVPAALYVGRTAGGELYSLYIPKTGWVAGKPGNWEAAGNDDVSLTVKHFTGLSVAEAQAAVLADEDGYSAVTADEDGWVTAADPADHMTLEIQFKTAPGGVYAILFKYPDEAAEGFGARLQAIADTFRTEAETARP